MSRPPADPVRLACLTAGGAGFMRPAPGTWGSLVGAAIFAVLWLTVGPHVPRGVFEIIIALAVALTCVPAVRWGQWAIEYFGREDPSQFVLDEVAGQWVTCLFLPLALGAGGSLWSPWSLWSLACVLGLQFLLFRIADIIKPQPAAYIDAHWPGGWGIMFDDLVAGVYANIAGQLLWRLTPLAAWLHASGVPHGFGG